MNSFADVEKALMDCAVAVGYPVESTAEDFDVAGVVADMEGSVVRERDRLRTEVARLRDASTPSRSGSELHDALHRYPGQKRIHTVVLPHSPRHVQQRNTEARPELADAVLLNDVWQALDDVLLTEDEPGASDVDRRRSHTHLIAEHADKPAVPVDDQIASARQMSRRAAHTAT